MSVEPGLRYLWRSGRIVESAQATVHVRSVGHASVSGVFEGVNAYWSDELGDLHVFRLREHLERLERSMRLSHLEPQVTLDEVEAGVLELLRRNEVRRDVHVRPWCFAAGNPIEQMVPAGAPCEVVGDAWPYSSGLREERTRTAVVSSWRRIDASSMPPRIKAFANYHNGRLGNAEAAERGGDWPIFLNEHGMLTESSGANLAIFKDGAFHTPSLECGILDGITRSTVMTLLSENLDVPVFAREIDTADLRAADELVFLGTSAEVLPIVAVDGVPVGDGGIGPLSARLRSEYDDVLRGRRPERMSWMTPVWGRPAAAVDT